MNLQLSLKRKWFEMTKAGIKTEDYREITPYWLNRVCDYNPNHTLYKENKDTDCADFVDLLLGYQGFIPIETVDKVGSLYGYKIKKFDHNIMTLGYPKSGDTSRILKLEHKGIEIRTGNPEWGAEPGKLYFVIKHGNLINE